MSNLNTVRSNCINQITPTENDLALIASLVPVSRETIELLQIYADLLLEWQKKTNLISRHTIGDLWRRHIGDSIQTFSIVNAPKTWIDLGSGAGFPGLVIAILARQYSNNCVHLVESNQKKCAFLRKVIRETSVNVQVHATRIESATKLIERCDIVTARALAPLERLLEYSHHWLEDGAVGIFAKGKNYSLEIEDCRGLWDFDLVKHDSIIAADSVLLELKNLRKI